MRDFRIELTGPGHGKVWIDGQEMTGIRAVRFEARVGDANVVTLEVFAKTLKVTAPIEEIEITEISDPAKKFARV